MTNYNTKSPVRVALQEINRTRPGRQNTMMNKMKTKLTIGVDRETSPLRMNIDDINQINST
jgi:hypothetical protein